MVSRFAVIVVTLSGCGAVTSGTPGGAGGGSGGSNGSPTCSSNNGQTECRGVTCQPGNYCSNAFYIKDYCKPGCTADSNCGQGDFCARCAGDAVGVCQRCGQAPACGQGSKCKTSNAASMFCVNAGLGSDAYQCSDSDRPVGQCSQHPMFSGTYCCGVTTAACTPDVDQNFMCEHLWMSLMAQPNDYQRAFKCAGNVTPSGRCHFDSVAGWCCT